ncbi:MAG: hypothetical protein AB7E09_08010 [Candidatus Izemoplasmatales bacterium]
MLKYIRLHLDYLMTKTFVIITIILFFILMLAYIYNSQVLDGYEYLDAYKYDFAYDFLNESFLVLEFITVFIGIYIGLNLGSKSNQALAIYTVTSKKAKRLFYSSRMITGLILITLVFICQILILHAYSHAFTPYIIDLKIYYLQAMYLYMENIQYYLLTLIFIMIFKHLLVGLIPLLMFWIFEIMWPQVNNIHKSIINNFIINIQGFDYIEKNLLFYLIIYHFLAISYIIILIQKDC